MKKLLFIHNKLVCGGAESALFGLLSGLDKSKYDVTVFVLNDGGEWEQMFKDAGIRVIHSYSRLIPGHRLKNFFLRNRIEYSRKHQGRNLISIATGEKFDMQISFHTPAYFKQVGMESGSRKIRYIHGDAANDSVLRAALESMSDNLESYDRFICVSEIARKSFHRVTGYGDRASVCYNPIDDERIRRLAMQPLPEPLPHKYICAIGRLSAEKGFERLIRIHHRLVQNGIGHHLVIIGEGPERSNLEKCVKQLGCEDTVSLLGYRDNPYMYIYNSRFTVCSSYSEGLSVIALESLCLGIPVVSAYPTVGELFGDECCGIITENDDASLECGIQKMLTDEDLYLSACESARRRSAAFTARGMIAQVESVFDEVLNS